MQVRNWFGRLRASTILSCSKVVEALKSHWPVLSTHVKPCASNGKPTSFDAQFMTSSEVTPKLCGDQETYGSCWLCWVDGPSVLWEKEHLGGPKLPTSVKLRSHSNQFGAQSPSTQVNSKQLRSSTPCFLLVLSIKHFPRGSSSSDSRKGWQARCFL